MQADATLHGFASLTAAPTLPPFTALSLSASEAQLRYVEQSTMTAWPDLFNRWHDAPNRADAYAVIEEARRFVAQPRPERWTWLSEALQDPKRRYFVAYVFERQPVPKALLAPMLEATIATDASSCRVFLRPLLGTFGQEEVRAELERYELTEQDEDKLEYWMTDHVESRR